MELITQTTIVQYIQSIEEIRGEVTQAQVASLVGVDVSTWRRWVAKRKAPKTQAVKENILTVYSQLVGEPTNV